MDIKTVLKKKLIKKSAKVGREGTNIHRGNTNTSMLYSHFKVKLELETFFLFVRASHAFKYILCIFNRMLNPDFK